MALQHPPGAELADPPVADPAAIGRWLVTELGDPRWLRCSVAGIGHGRSNLTYRVDSPAGAVVLRRPPGGAVAATAHDMGREARVVSALAGTRVPVPAILAVSTGGPPVGAPCYAMELVDGVVPGAELPAGWAAEPADRHRLGLAMVDVLADLHAVDAPAIGLADLGRPEGFLARQVRRWSTQWRTWQAASGADDATAAELTDLADLLASRLPASQRAGIVHGDYRIDNLVFDRNDPGRIHAVLDWEMSTLGDPLADLGLLMIYWYQPDDPPVWRAAQNLPSPTRLPGFPTRAELAQRYAQRSGADLTDLGWCAALGAFKLAVVLAGILARVRSGAMPADTVAGLEHAMAPTVALGHHLLRDGLGAP